MVVGPMNSVWTVLLQFMNSAATLWTVNFVSLKRVKKKKKRGKRWNENADAESKPEHGLSYSECKWEDCSICENKYGWEWHATSSKVSCWHDHAPYLLYFKRVECRRATSLCVSNSNANNILSMKKIQDVISLPTRKRSKAMRFKNMDSVSSSTKDDWEP